MTNRVFKYAFLRAVSALAAIGMLLVSAGLSRGESYDVREPETCLLNFSVLSDSHIEGNNLMRYKVFAAALQDVKRCKSGNDAVVFLGDNTMNGHHFENMLFHGTAALLLRGGTILPALGNHDIGNGQGDYETLQNRWYDYSAAFFGVEPGKPYYYRVIDGYYFIVMGMQGQEVYKMPVTDAQFAWLEDVLQLAAESGKPAFLFKHYPSDDAADENGKYTDRLIRMLASYSREHDLFSFVGHTHMPMGLDWSFHTDDGFPETYLPRLTELGGEKDNQPHKGTGVGLAVEVYEHTVVLRARDYYRGAWKTDTSADGQTVPCEKTYARQK